MLPEKPLTAVLLIAHGSRLAEANAELLRLADAVRAAGYPLVEPAYLELATPDIPTAGAACVARGAAHVVLLPYFLSAGTHVAHDLERQRHELANRFPRVSFGLCPPLGSHPGMLQIILDRLNTACSRPNRADSGPPSV